MTRKKAAELTSISKMATNMYLSGRRPENWPEILNNRLQMVLAGCDQEEVKEVEAWLGALTTEQFNTMSIMSGASNEVIQGMLEDAPDSVSKILTLLYNNVVP